MTCVDHTNILLRILSEFKWYNPTTGLITFGGPRADMAKRYIEEITRDIGNGNGDPFQLPASPVLYSERKRYNAGIKRSELRHQGRRQCQTFDPNGLFYDSLPIIFTTSFSPVDYPSAFTSYTTHDARDVALCNKLKDHFGALVFPEFITFDRIKAFFVDPRLSHAEETTSTQTPTTQRQRLVEYTYPVGTVTVPEYARHIKKCIPPWLIPRYDPYCILYLYPTNAPFSVNVEPVIMHKEKACRLFTLGLVQQTAAGHNDANYPIPGICCDAIIMDPVAVGAMVAYDALLYPCRTLPKSACRRLYYDTSTPFYDPKKTCESAYIDPELDIEIARLIEQDLIIDPKLVYTNVTEADSARAVIMQNNPPHVQAGMPDIVRHTRRIRGVTDILKACGLKQQPATPSNLTSEAKRRKLDPGSNPTEVVILTIDNDDDDDDDGPTIADILAMEARAGLPLCKK